MTPHFHTFQPRIAVSIYSLLMAVMGKYNVEEEDSYTQSRNLIKDSFKNVIVQSNLFLIK